jgi:hypothetical protein
MWRGILAAHELGAFQAALVETHGVSVEASILNNDGDHLRSITHMILDGQINVDMGADVTRGATLSLLDPDRSLPFDSDSPSDGALYLDRMVRITYSVRVPSLNDRVDVPVFTGPVSKVDRSDDVVNVECQGKEALAMNAAWVPMVIGKKTLKTDAIRRIMAAAGESRFSFPELTARLPHAVPIVREAIPWQVAKRIAHGMNRQLFYDGAGVLRLRAWPGTAVYTFRTGIGANITSTPQISYSLENVSNLVWVVGGKPKGAKKPVSYVARPSPTHPLSSARLGRNGHPRRLLLKIEDSSIRSVAEARRLAERRLKDALRAHVEVTFDSLPVPHLDPGDLIRVTTDEFSHTYRLATYSLPLGTGGAMSVGYHKVVSSKKRRIRRP